MKAIHLKGFISSDKISIPEVAEAWKQAAIDAETNGATLVVFELHGSLSYPIVGAQSVYREIEKIESTLQQQSEKTTGLFYVVYKKYSKPNAFNHNIEAFFSGYSDNTNLPSFTTVEKIAIKFSPRNAINTINEICVRLPTEYNKEDFELVPVN